MTIVGTAAEFLAAISALPDDGDVIILLPGTYDFTDPINLPSNITIIGSGINATTLNFSGNGFVFTTTGDHYCQYVNVKLLTINTATDSGGTGFSVNTTTSPVVKDLTEIILTDLFMSCDGICIDLDPESVRSGEDRVYSQQTLIENVTFDTCGAGLVTINGNVNFIRRCTNQHDGRDGVSVADGLYRVVGIQNHLVDNIGGISQEVPAVFYVEGICVVSNCHAEGEQSIAA